MQASLAARASNRPWAKGLVEAVLHMVMASSKRSVPDVLRGLGCHGVNQRVSSLYKEVMQRYLMRLRVEFKSAKYVTVCADKSKVRGHFPQGNGRKQAVWVSRVATIWS